ncbi:HigA family addiction module antitoxin [Pectobacterium polaris]|uniref:Addiction module antidote protein, HigA family n=1 Tax=Pectobacterium polaris TaxID=2042057 RepID=A0AAW5GLH4_9GAMM|nr:HigA family addiction module antitoxin [Pectobacterium polaris]MCL6353576.1 addiction module antidote protein, HigA family [Pectobacterium polaris]MCL6370967.1 addiction module antidote protein, HigA family [Pectobacterium polaris]
MSTEKSEPTTVGEMLNEEFLIPLNISPNELAALMGTSHERIRLIIENGQRLTPEEAMLFSEIFSTDVLFWTRLQKIHDAWASK